ncbi:MAG: glycoside hydrolase family 27 protein [Steroidobacteraceae bacterium]
MKSTWIAITRLAVMMTALLSVLPAIALDNGQARTPPMGWNSWNKFQCNVSEVLIKEMADAMVRNGMKAAGYQYVIIDDCWQVSRDAQGNIVPDAERFPSGMKALADYIHRKGLKFGLYSDAGEYTCQRRPGSKGYEVQDAKQYAAWGVDYLKYDWCNTSGMNAQEAYTKMRDAIAASGRPMVFSICEWGSSKPWTWAQNVGNLWRTTGDITDAWSSTGRQFGPPPGEGGAGMSAGMDAGNAPPPGPPPAGMPAMGLGFLQILDQQAELADAAGPGHWNDPDMLEVGNGGMTDSEYQAHFSLWAMLASPLMAGNDLRNMTPSIKTILTNKEIIALNQDKLGKQATRLKRDGDLDVWVKQLADGSRAVALLNRGATSANMGVSWNELGLTDKKLSVRDLWQHKKRGKHKHQFSTEVAGHSVVVVKIR